MVRLFQDIIYKYSHKFDRLANSTGRKFALRLYLDLLLTRLVGVNQTARYFADAVRQRYTGLEHVFPVVAAPPVGGTPPADADVDPARQKQPPPLPLNLGVEEAADICASAYANPPRIPTAVSTAARASLGVIPVLTHPRMLVLVVRRSLSDTCTAMRRWT